MQGKENFPPLGAELELKSEAIGLRLFPRGPKTKFVRNLMKYESKKQFLCACSTFLSNSVRQIVFQPFQAMGWFAPKEIVVVGELFAGKKNGWRSVFIRH